MKAKRNKSIDSILDHNSDIPLYRQLAEHLEKSIGNELLPEKEKIPSENSLCSTYGVSRITVRQALNLLEQKGLIYTVHGKGTFVKFPVISQQLFKISRFSKILQVQGIKGHTKVLSYHSNVKVDEQTEIIMKTNQYGPLCRLELVGYAQSIPIVYYSSLLRNELGARLYQTASELVEQEYPFSTYDLLHKAKIRIGQINQVIKACNAGQEIGDILHIPPEMPMIILETVINDIHNVPVELKLGYYRGDKYTFELKREL